MAKNLKEVGKNNAGSIQSSQQKIPDSVSAQKVSTDSGINQTIQITKSGNNFSIKSPGSIEERIMLALTGALKENRDEMENLLKDIEKLGSKKNMTDKDKNDLQVLQIKLQVSISRRNEMVSTLSNIMKTFNEMNMATIRNIRI